MLETTAVDELDQAYRSRASLPDQRGTAPENTNAGGPASHDSDSLLAVVRSVRAGAPETTLTDAVKTARDHGWGWSPIAIVLGATRADTVERFSRAIGHPVSHRRA